MKLRKVRYIVIHSAASGNSVKDWDISAKDIDRIHKKKGWSKIGYHFVIRKDGTVEPGRSLDEAGAHVQGMNSYSIGVCFSGHGDISPLTEAQIRTGRKLLRELLRRFGLTPDRIIGHTEAQKKLGGKATKTCPGKKVDVEKLFREYLTYELSQRPFASPGRYT